jgi:hypothetical protein
MCYQVLGMISFKQGPAVLIKNHSQTTAMTIMILDPPQQLKPLEEATLSSPQIRNKCLRKRKLIVKHVKA